MRKSLCGLILVPLLLAAASPKMRIGYYGHAFFEVVLPNGVRVAMDPFDPTHVPNPIGLDFPEGVEADVVVITHSHFDHYYWQGIGGSPDVFVSTSGSSNGIDITAHPTKHRPLGPEGENYIMTWQWGDIKFAHMGGYQDDFSAGDSTVLAGSDFIIFMLFTTGGGTPFIDQIQPPVALPNHYFTEDHNPYYEDALLTLEEVNENLDYPIVTIDDAWIAVDIDNLSGSTVIWEPSYSPALPGDLEISSVDITESSPYMIGVSLENNSSRDATDAPLILNILDDTGIVHADTASVSVPGNSQDFYQFGPWQAPQSKEYTLFAEIAWPADEVPPNDTASATIFLTSISETRSANRFELSINLGNDLEIDYSLPTSSGELVIYDASGAAVDRFNLYSNSGRLSYPLHLSQGVYFARIETPEGSIGEKFMILR